MLLADELIVSFYLSGFGNSTHNLNAEEGGLGKVDSCGLQLVGVVSQWSWVGQGHVEKHLDKKEMIVNTFSDVVRW